MAKYLDKTGVDTLWKKIKSIFATKASLSVTDNQVNTLVNTTRELTNRTTNLDNNKLGKTETAVKANGVTDYGDRSKTINIGWSGSGLTNNVAAFAAYQDGTHIKDISIDNTKNVLGINNLATKSEVATADSKAQQAINQINSVNQDKITKGDLVFSLSGSTLTITKRY